MFVRDFIHVAQPFEEIAPRFLRDPRWLHPIVDEAIGEAAALWRELEDGTPVERRGLGDPMTVHLDQGPIRSRPKGIVVPISWADVVDTDWFPPVSGDLEVAPIGLERSELVLWGRYQSEQPGAQRIVETGVRAFLQRLAAALQTEALGRAR